MRSQTGASGYRDTPLFCGRTARGPCSDHSNGQNWPELTLSEGRLGLRPSGQPRLRLVAHTFSVWEEIDPAITETYPGFKQFSEWPTGRCFDGGSLCGSSIKAPRMAMVSPQTPPTYRYEHLFLRFSSCENISYLSFLVHHSRCATPTPALPNHNSHLGRFHQSALLGHSISPSHIFSVSSSPYISYLSLLHDQYA